MSIELTADDFPQEFQVMADQIGVDNTRILLDTFAGSEIYFPRNKVRRKAIKRYILANIKQKKISELALGAGVSRRTIFNYMNSIDTP